MNDAIQKYQCCSCKHVTHKLRCIKCAHRICMLCKKQEKGVRRRPRGSIEGRELSYREVQFLKMFCAGKRGSEIAAELQLSYKTVSTYKTRAAAKLGLLKPSDVSLADSARVYIDSLNQAAA